MGTLTTNGQRFEIFSCRILYSRGLPILERPIPCSCSVFINTQATYYDFPLNSKIFLMRSTTESFFSLHTQVIVSYLTRDDSAFGICFYILRPKLLQFIK